MDHEQRTKVSEQLNPEWAARVVRNIGVVEADFFHAAGHLSERMMAEALLAIEKVVTPPWILVENEWMPQVVCPEWKMTRGVGTGDMWLQLSEISHDEDENEHTWIAAATKTGPSFLCIEVVFRKGLQDHAEAIVRDDKAVAALLKQGFAREDESFAMYLPFQIPAEKLAQGFEQNDLTAVVAPFGKAMAQAMAARPLLDKLLEQVREAAKRK
ncbi:hypothetical protein [Novosphingobium sp. CECT 9465]|uniref:hypothetical protein n=1 Tax=Novosphingobium sp. CECT 9465 TaxID=2829794 RepID=UPI001E368559|nr:hypothetical protein [Novosphingobium sp. CECT 9465]CAH0497229.1 hypothetical protein NVSP9465_02281 [Novosphingobium sp. CECT 9465]